MSNKLRENLEFKIGLSGSYWSRKPQYTIGIDGKEYKSGTITGDSNEVEFLEFQAEVEEDQEHTIEIGLVNKTDHDCFVDDQGQIVRDMLLNIESIEIDGIDLGNLKWSASEFTPLDPELAPLSGCVNLGWNGTYRLKITSPFYLWLLDNL